MKRLNEYALAGGAALYELAPKSVWAALAVSALAHSRELDQSLADGEREAIAAAVLDEWDTLHRQGIVPQAPPGLLRARLAHDAAHLLASTSSRLRVKVARPRSCPDCGQAGERAGHQECQYPRDHDGGRS